jgi:hypothetical protein
MRTRVVASLLALLVALGLAGCGSDEPATAPRPAASASPTAPPGLDSTAPEKPAAADTARSAVAYADYFALLVQHAVRIRSARPVLAETFDQAACSVCRQLGTFVDDLVSGGYWEIGDDLDIGTLKATALKDGFRVAGRFIYPRATYVTVEGTDKGSVTAKTYRYSVDLTWDRPNGRWRVRDYVFDTIGPAK